MNEAEALIQRQVEAYNAHDLDGFVACFADDAVLTDLASGRVFASGRAQIREAYTATFERLPRAEVTIAARIGTGAIVVDVEHIQADGSHVVAVYRTAGDAITHLWLVPPALVEV
jgi:uncharacterized protein (TIGR02246 family)